MAGAQKRTREAVARAGGLVLELRQAGWTYGDIAAELTRRGIPPLGAGPWNKVTANNLVRAAARLRGVVLPTSAEIVDRSRAQLCEALEALACAAQAGSTPAELDEARRRVRVVLERRPDLAWEASAMLRRYRKAVPGSMPELDELMRTPAVSHADGGEAHERVA
jgi:hypothetical protein